MLITILVGVRLARAQTYVTISRPEEARFRLLTEEGIVQPDQKQFIPAAKVWTVMDKKSGRCFMLFFTANAPSTVGPTNCP